MVAGLTGAVLIGYRYGITLWDWIKLLIVPAVIAGGGLWFNRQQQDRQREDEQRQQERGLEIENQRAQDEALQAYLDQMSQLLIDKDLLNVDSNGAQAHGSRSVARARTLTVLPRLDGRRKRSVLQFLVEAGLIDRACSIDDLTGADLEGADLLRGQLERTDLREAYLFGANLAGAHLARADLSGANLQEANLKAADLIEAELSNTILGMADLLYANLSKANLNGADLRWANLNKADLRGANLSEASLQWANLQEADLSEARGFTEEQLAAASSLQGATMPNGQKYEEWLKSRGEDGEGE
jgi:uncharacterized protein YjbI with pentapeptide repeats